MLGDDLHHALGVEGSTQVLQELAPVALDQPFDEQEQIGPDRLRAGEAAPQPSRQGVGEDQDARGKNEKTRDQIEVLRPYLGEKEVQPSMDEIEQERLIRRIRPLTA